MKTFISALFLTALFISFSCSKEDETISGKDLELFNLTQETENFTWYKMNDDLLPRSSGSGHSQPYLRTRYNEIAATHLDSVGKPKTEGSFPEGSLIVKELYANESEIDVYAILLKQTNDAYADENGWVWGYVTADKKVVSPSANKGVGCIECHAQTGHVDYTLMNKFFP